MQTLKTGKRKTLHLQKVSLSELSQNWGFTPVGIKPGSEIFIRSDRKGNINWDKAPVYTWKEVQEQQKIRPVHFTVNPEIFKLP